MLDRMNYQVSSLDLKDCKDFVYNFQDFKTSINQPTGNFFYDPWEIKQEFKDSCLANVLGVLDFPIGEARIIALESKCCYTQHADIDDRFHLNITGDAAYLLNLEDNKSYHTKADGLWYHMNTGKLHTAVNCGEFVRYQLVVRALLQKNNLQNPINLKLFAGGTNPRYKFDNFISPWLNLANKNRIINNFSVDFNLGYASFDIEQDHLNSFKEIVPKDFQLESSPPVE